MTRPSLRSRWGNAARTTAAVPSRLTATTRSQASASTSASRPQASMPAAVTTPAMAPCSPATAATAASAARLSARSTWCAANPLAGGARSRTTGTPPASCTAWATASPRPDDPPVTMTVPSSDAMDGGPLEDSCARLALQEREQDDLAAPPGQHARLGQLAVGVVGALGPDVRTQALEHRRGRVLVEDHHAVDAAQRPQDGGAVLLAHDRAAGALERPHRGVGVEAHDEDVAQRARRLESADVSGVQEVEAAARGDDDAPGRARRARQRDGIVRRR